MKYLHRVFFIGIFKTNSHRKRRKKHEKKTKRMIVKLVVGPREREREEGVRAETSHWHSELVIIRIKK